MRAKSRHSTPTRRSIKRSGLEDSARRSSHQQSRKMKATRRLGVLAVVVLLGGQVLGQGTPAGAPAKSPDAAKNPWAYNLTVDGYIWKRATTPRTFERDRCGPAITSPLARIWC